MRTAPTECVRDTGAPECVLTEPTVCVLTETTDCVLTEPTECVLTEATQECVLSDVLTEPTEGGRPELADGGDPEECQQFSPLVLLSRCGSPHGRVSAVAM